MDETTVAKVVDTTTHKSMASASRARRECEQGEQVYIFDDVVDEPEGWVRELRAHVLEDHVQVARDIIALVSLRRLFRRFGMAIKRVARQYRGGEQVEVVAYGRGSR